MRSFSSVVIFFATILVLTACYRRNGFGIRGKGDDVTETRAITGFESVDLSIDGNVEFTQDSVWHVELTGQPNILAVTTTEVRGGELKIGYKGNVWDHHIITLRIYAPNAHGFKISGSGNITTMNNIVTDNIKCGISGSGNIKIPSLKTGRTEASISGSGSISVDSGSTDSENFVISGSGNINCGNFVSSSSTCRISGSGNITTHATNELSAIISGSGDIRYHGKPAVTVQISGSGNLIHLD